MNETIENPTPSQALRRTLLAQIGLSLMTRLKDNHVGTADVLRDVMTWARQGEDEALHDIDPGYVHAVVDLYLALLTDQRLQEGLITLAEQLANRDTVH